MAKVLRENLLRDVQPARIDKERLQSIRTKVLSSDKCIVVLDDDPTGTQTVYDVKVLTVWDVESVVRAFAEGHVFYILTNSRGLGIKDAEKLIREIMINIIEASKITGKDFVIVNRGDSTLRGHYPMESNAIREEIEKRLNRIIHGEIIIPYFKEGKRYTYLDVHYIEDNDWWTPVGESEFAKDLIFGYNSSNLKEWIEEKTFGAINSREVISIDIETIRTKGIEAIVDILMTVENFQKVIVNAIDDSDLEIFVEGLIKAEEKGKNFVYRTAASFVRIRAGIDKRKLLEKNDIITKTAGNGGLVVVGSFVRKSSIQLEHAMESPNATAYEIDAAKLVGSEASRDAEVKRIVTMAENCILSGKTAIIYTSRKLLGADSKDENVNMNISQVISASLVAVVKGIKIPPSYIIAKGGITSSDIATKALGIKETRVLGQIRYGIPVWSVDETLSYIIFPGNVGGEHDLEEIIEELKGGDCT